MGGFRIDDAQPMLGGRLSLPTLRSLASWPQLRVAVEFWRSPRRTVRKWRLMRRPPTPSEFDRMSRAEFATYVEEIGFDAEINAALAELDESPTDAHADDEVRASAR